MVIANMTPTSIIIMLHQQQMYLLFSVYTLKTTLSAIYHLSPAFAWQGTSGDISADVFSTSEPSAWRSLVETTTSIQGHATQ